MRVTNRASTRNYLRYVNKGLSDQAKTQEKVASGNRFEKVSDDVSSGIKAMKARSDQYKMEKQIGNIEDINNVLVAAEDSMQSIDDQLKTVYARFLRAMNDTNQNNRNIFAAEIKALKEEILQLANSKYNDQFLFSGSNNYDAPFSVDKETGHLVYNGIGVPTDEIFQREDGTYCYGSIVRDEDGNPIEKVVPVEGQLETEKITTTTPKDFHYVPAHDAIDGKWVEGVGGNGTTGPNSVQDGNTLYVGDGTTYSALDMSSKVDASKVDTAATGVPLANGTSVAYPSKDDPTVLYVQDPTGNSTDYYKVQTNTETTETTLEFTLNGNQIVDAAGKTIDVTLKDGTTDTYEAEDGTLFVPDPNKPGTFNQVFNKKDVNGDVIKRPLRTNIKDVPLNEEIYLDVGLGIRMNGSTVDPQTAFNVSYCGPEILGFGINEENGLSNNIYNLLNDMEDMLKNPDKYSTDDAQIFGNQLLDRLDAFRENITDLGAKTQFLETMLDRLNKSRDNLEISIGNYTGTDYVEESRHQASASAVINALYQLGSNIIPLSLMDFVK